MRNLLLYILCISFFYSCSQNDFVQISGRVENADSTINIWVDDSVYTFLLDENKCFSGSIKMKRSGYATLMNNSLNLYLAPGQDLEIYANEANFLSSLYFRGSLGGINGYLKEQEVATFFDRDDYELPDTVFLSKMNALIDEKLKLLKAKNFDEYFTSLESERIRYSIAALVSFYPIYHKQIRTDKVYRSSPALNKFISSFSIQKDELFGSKDYRTFLLNYVYLKGGRGNRYQENDSNGIVDYVLSTISNASVRNFLLTEIVFRHIRDHNGLNGADYLLSVFRKECTDKSNISYIEKLVDLWENITVGKVAPDFTALTLDGSKVSLSDFNGSYVYIMVWASWCVPCKSELVYLHFIHDKYFDRNIKFITVSMDDLQSSSKWKSYLKLHPTSGLHTIIEAKSEFAKKYMIISVPRFIFISPDGKIINSNAPRPSGQMLQYLESFQV